MLGTRGAAVRDGCGTCQLTCLDVGTSQRAEDDLDTRRSGKSHGGKLLTINAGLRCLCSMISTKFGSSPDTEDNHRAF